MKIKFYTLTTDQFAIILREARAYGVPYSCYVTQFSQLWLATNMERDVYFFSVLGGEHQFFAEYVPKLENLTVMTGDIKALEYHFPTVKFIPE